ncbi:hypothetical protein ACH4FX_41640 [Streptomyces sp. NPDC018019]|uniref:hypothetical protein n=1 Tax=Streptomyces sp. NPDC018019 TaxID=3365030 RepID=UPI0037B554B5
MDQGEELLRGRVYGTDFDDPHPGPRPGRTYAELVGGPLDGLLLDITGWTTEEIATGAALMAEIDDREGDDDAHHGGRGSAADCAVSADGLLVSPLGFLAARSLSPLRAAVH